VDAFKNFKIVKVNVELCVLTRWMAVNKLVLNVAKTKAMTLNMNGDRSARNIIINGEVVEMVNNFTYLGVDIDSKLNLKGQFEKSLLQFKQKVSLLRRFKYSMPKKTKEMLFKSLARPHLQYCSLLWFMADKYTINKVQVQINSAMRTILKGKWDTPIRTMLYALDWLTFEETISVDVMTFIFKIDNDLTPSYLKLPIMEEIYDYNTRSKDNFVRNESITARKSIYLEGLSEYYRLSPEIRSSPSVPLFRKKLINKVKSARV